MNTKKEKKKKNLLSATSYTLISQLQNWNRIKATSENHTNIQCASDLSMNKWKRKHASRAVRKNSAGKTLYNDSLYEEKTHMLSKISFLFERENVRWKKWTWSDLREYIMYSLNKNSTYNINVFHCF